MIDTTVFTIRVQGLPKIGGPEKVEELFFQLPTLAELILVIQRQIGVKEAQTRAMSEFDDDDATWVKQEIVTLKRLCEIVSHAHTELTTPGEGNQAEYQVRVADVLIGTIYVREEHAYRRPDCDVVVMGGHTNAKEIARSIALAVRRK